jgi:hypothetical protein
MTLKPISLTFAERNMLEFYFGSMTSVKAADAAMVKAIRKAFDSKTVIKTLDKFSRKAAEVGMPGLGWGDVVDTADYAEMLEEVTADAKDAPLKDDKPETAAAREKQLERLDQLAERLAKIDTAEAEYHLDDVYLKWLRDAFGEKYDLAKRTVGDGQGGTRQIDLPVPVDQIEVFANLVDKVKTAAA